MLLGPVFRAELIRTARRRRYYVLRAAYGFVLLFLLWECYRGFTPRSRSEPGLVSVNDLTAFALSTFIAFVILQSVTLLLLIPPLLGGAITDEKQRRTLHDLMASRLSSAEIVLDKLAARSLHIGVFVALGIPVTCSLGLIGGVAPEYVVAAYACTVSSAFLAAALTILVSTLARGVRQSVLIAYLLLLAWLIVPVAADLIGRVVFPNAYQWLAPINEWVQATSPLSLFWGIMSFPWTQFGRRPPISPTAPVAWMVGEQVVVGSCVLLLAILQLRPTFRRQEVGNRRLHWFAARERKHPRRRRWYDRPPCGDLAVHWKERYFARTDVFTKLFVLPATVLVSVVLAFASGIDETAWHAFGDLFHHGYRNAAHDSRRDFNASLQMISAYYIGLWLLAVAGAASSCVTVEREEDTWVSLMSTPMSGREILLGKMVGTLWGLRGFGAFLGLLWLAGLVAGAVHPLGLLAALAVLGLLTAFVAALGTLASLRAQTTSRAVARTIAILLALNGGCAILLFPLVEDTSLLTLGFTPHLSAGALLSPEHVGKIGETFFSKQPGSIETVRHVAFASCVLLLYASAAALLTSRALGLFDRIVDRPRRPQPRPQASPMTIGARIWNRKRLIAAIVGPTVVMGALLLSPEVRDRVALHGTWTIVSVQSSGTSTAVRRGGQVTFDGMTSAFLFVGSSGRFTLDPGAALKGIDMKVDLPEGSVPANGWDGILHGLYELDGSTLRFCWMPGRNERPATIPAAPTPGVEVLVLRRAKTR